MSVSFKAFQVSEQQDGSPKWEIISKQISDLPENEVLIKVAFSGLNYKDALCAYIHKGITKIYPHTPGIDASGIVVLDKSGSFSVGDEVLVTSYDLGMNTSGGFAEYISVPASWVIKLPKSISLADAMILGTAGLTAAISIYQMMRNNQKNLKAFPVLVTGASGGVGSFAVAMLHKAGLNVIASTGKKESHNYLRELGANEIVDRESVNCPPEKPILKPIWGGAIDTVGGNTLVTCLKGCQLHGNVAACGNVSDNTFTSTIYPFIIRGVNLLGIESATFPMEQRKEVWNLIAEHWLPNDLSSMATFIKLEELITYIPLIKEGKTQGRVVVSM